MPGEVTSAAMTAAMTAAKDEDLRRPPTDKTDPTDIGHYGLNPAV
jgi:hypothetical protein